MARLRYNGLSATLGASLTSSATPVTFGAALTHSNGTNVPTITGSDYIPLAILDTSGHLSEIVWLTAYTAAATTGTIARGKEGTTGVSHSSGDKVIQGPTALDTSGETAWTNATYAGAWTSYGAPYADAGYRKDSSGVVHLRGLIKSGTIGTTAFTLPSGYRPAFKVSHATFNVSGTGNIDVNTDGTVIPATGGNTYASLDGITFYTD
jgi:hypothetical protein